MESRWVVVLTVALLAVSAPVAAKDIPRPFSATYIGRPYVVGKLETVITLERIGGHLKYTMLSKASAPFYRNEFYECSVMAVRGERLYPLEYKHTDTKDAAKNVSVRFDWDANAASVTRADGQPTRITGLVWPVWDPLSLQVGIMTDIINEKFGTEKMYRLLERGTVNDRRLRRVVEDGADTDTASRKTVRVERADGGAPRLWFAREHGYIPVTIEFKNIRVELASELSRVSRDAAVPNGEIPHC